MTDPTREALLADSLTEAIRAVVRRPLLAAYLEDFKAGRIDEDMTVNAITGDILAALSTTPAPLDAAWNAAEAALPEGWHLAGVRHRWQYVTTREDATGERCREYSFGAGLPSYQATVYQPNEITLAEDAVDGWGDTPAAALLALAEKLCEYAKP